MIDPGQDSDLCGRSLEFAPSSALLRRASTYLAVAPDLPLWLPMPAKDVEPLVCLGLSAHPTVPCPTAQQIFLDPGQHVGQSYQSLRNEAWTCLGENEIISSLASKESSQTTTVISNGQVSPGVLWPPWCGSLHISGTTTA